MADPMHTPMSSQIYDSTAKFLIEFHTAILERNYDLMKRLYEQDFPYISDTEYPKRRWPEEKRVLDFYNEHKISNEVVLSLYREMYFQHAAARTPETITWNDRFLASCNYSRLFEYFINVECDKDNRSVLALPESWLWDMINNLVSQYQETQIWKAHYAQQIASNEEAMHQLRAGRGAWRASNIFRTLHSLIERSGVKEWLADHKANYYSSSTMRQRSDVRAQPPIFLGYFAMICLMKLLVALGNYRTALEEAALIELSPKALYWTVPACHITLYYNLGFAYMMMRRYQDAIRVLSQILIFVNKNPNYITSQNDQQKVMSSLVDRMHCLIMLCEALSPKRLDESIQDQIVERWGVYYKRLESDEDEDSAFKDLFMIACPQFFSPIISEYDNPEEHAKIDENEPLNRQINMFLKDVKLQKQVLNVRSIAKLYNNLTLSKLANLMGMKDATAVDTVQSKILSVKTRAEQLIWQSGPFLSGKRVQTLTDLDIYLEMNTIHVKNLTAQQNYVEDFLKEIKKTQELMTVLNSMSTKNEALSSKPAFI